MSMEKVKMLLASYFLEKKINKKVKMMLMMIGGEGEIKGKVLFFDNDISGQPS